MDNSGLISFDEFLNWVAHLVQLGVQKLLWSEQEAAPTKMLVVLT